MTKPATSFSFHDPKVVIKIAKNLHVCNGRTDFLVTIKGLLRFLNRT